MQLITIQDIKNLLAETGHALTVEDFEPVIELDNAAEIVVSGAKDSDDSVFSFPILCGGQAFYSPTIGKQLYWQENIQNVLSENWYTCAYLWLLSCKDVPSERGSDILKAVKKWARKSKLTDQDVDYIISLYSNEETKENRAKYGEIIALLVREYGNDCDHWLNAPDHEITMLLADWTRRQEQKAAAYRQSRAGSKNPLPPLPSPKIKAQKRYRELKNQLRDKWLKSE